jgi:hypothetical protein
MEAVSGIENLRFIIRHALLPFNPDHPQGFDVDSD